MSTCQGTRDEQTQYRSPPVRSTCHVPTSELRIPFHRLCLLELAQAVRRSYFGLASSLAVVGLLFFIFYHRNLGLEAVLAAAHLTYIGACSELKFHGVESERSQTQMTAEQDRIALFWDIRSNSIEKSNRKRRVTWHALQIYEYACVPKMGERTEGAQHGRQ